MASNMQRYQTASATSAAAASKDGQSSTSAAAIDAAVTSAFSSLINSAGGLQALQPATAPASAAQAPATGHPQAKRKQVKNACTNCQKACKKCDDARPCPRCVKYGISDSCVNSVRKERKKGIKRGPYKRRHKAEDGKTSQSAGDGQGGKHAEESSSHHNGVNPPPLIPYGYPNLQQYAQTLGTAYGYKDQVMSNPNSFVVGAVYPSTLDYPMVVTGGTRDAQHKQQQESKANDDAKDTKTDRADEKRASTPVPDASTSSGTSTPESAHDEEAKNFERLSQLCTAALEQNDNTSNRDVQDRSDN